MHNTLNGSGHRPAQPAPQQPATALGACVGCLGDRKGAEMALLAQLPVGTMPSPEQAAALPPVMPAICLIGGTGSCYLHLQVQQQTGLILPNGTPR